MAPVGAAGGLGAPGAERAVGIGAVDLVGSGTGMVSSRVGTGAVDFRAVGVGAVAFFGSGTTPVDFLGWVMPVPGLARRVMRTVSFLRGTVEVLAVGFAGGWGGFSSLIGLLYLKITDSAKCFFGRKCGWNSDVVWGSKYIDRW